MTVSNLRKTEHLINFIQTQETFRTKNIIRILLLSLKEHQAILRILIPIRILIALNLAGLLILYSIKFFEESSITTCCVGNLYGFLNFLLLASFLINNSISDLLRLNIVFQLAINSFAKTLNNTTAIFLEALIDSCVGSSKSKITLTKNIVRSQQAAKRQNAKSYGRSIKFNQLNSRLRINNGQVFLSVLLRILFLGNIFTLKNSANIFDLRLSALQNIIHFSRCFASHNGTGHNANSTGCCQDFRTVLTKFKTRLSYSMANAFNNCIIHNYSFSFFQIFNMINKTLKIPLRLFQILQPVFVLPTANILKNVSCTDSFNTFKIKRKSLDNIDSLEASFRYIMA